LKALAKEFARARDRASQLNRQRGAARAQETVMSDLRESGAIEQDAAMILLIYREEVYDKNTTKKGIAEIDLAKHRNGEIGTFLLTFQGQFTRFANSHRIHTQKASCGESAHSGGHRPRPLCVITSKRFASEPLVRV